MKKAENTTNKDYMELNFGLPVDRVKSNEELQDIARLVYNLLAEQGVSLAEARYITSILNVMLGRGENILLLKAIR